MTLWTNNLNGITSGATVTTGNSGGTSGTAFSVVLAPSGGSITAATAAAYEGTNGLQIVFPSASTSGYAAWTTSGAVGTRVSGSFWYKFGAAPSALDQIMSLGGLGTIRVTTSGQLAFYDTGPTVKATATAVTAGTWVFIQWATTSSATAGAGRYEFRVTRSDGTSLVSYDSGNTVTLTGSFSTFYMGRPGAGAIALTSSYDLLAVDNTLSSGFPGSAAPTPTLTGGMKVWTGSAWVIKPVKVWTGSAWVVKPVKRWTGSAWVLTP
jgi:hypothetical protein